MTALARHRWWTRTRRWLVMATWPLLPVNYRGRKWTVRFALAATLVTAASMPTLFAGHTAAVPAGPQVTEFSQCPRLFTPAGEQELWARRVEGWHAVRPHWLVGTLVETPAPESIGPDREDSPRHTATLALNLRTGEAKSVRAEAGDRILQCIPFGTGQCGIVTVPAESTGRPQPCRLRLWELGTDRIGEARSWHPLLNPVARVVDMDRVTVTWQPAADRKPASSTVALHQQNGGTVAVPAPLKDYRLPVEMSALWEEGRETRWYAPGDGVGVILYRGTRAENEEGYSAASELTHYDPRSEEGVRWRRRLADLAEFEGREIQSVLPIFSPWNCCGDMIIECGCVDSETRKRTAELIRVDLSDGTVRRVGGFDATDEFHFLIRRWWPRPSADLDRVVYITGANNLPYASVVYSTSERKLLPQIQTPWPLADGLRTVSPTDEAIIEDPWRITAVGIGRENYGQVREVRRLFTEENRD